MFIGSGKEPDIFPHAAMIPGNHVAENGGIGVPDVRLVIYIINWRSQIK